ncbi:hypothetical protein QBC38DRAFT_537588 [Podospora fimiseda]|uniref:Aminoglycoside phosphotransferase domain-containing protein n=1 Tax=Podospora fimiseda TaxID=252190 RepID=A0AAN7GZL2_9PEZI|nr:hypothetical protein QBC38DRAFT_537588 [Podospora fimiseda]
MTGGYRQFCLVILPCNLQTVALRKYAAAKRNGIDCFILADIGLGYNHMVRIMEFTDRVRWVARLRLPSLSGYGSPEDALEAKSNCRSDCSVKAPFMLMDCLKGNVGMDLGMEIPPEFKKSFLNDLAKAHVQLSTVQLPQIATIVSFNAADGTCQQGPIPELGGPFNTATEFFQAWAAKARFGMTEEKLRQASGPYAAEIVPSVSSFPESIGRLADRLSVLHRGPFPVCHGDFGHNIIVGDAYQILGIIDWETAFAGPWEMFGDFPLSLSTVPRAMDVPWNYNEDGIPKDSDLVRKFADREDYVTAVAREEEDQIGEEDHRLLYEIGKAGWYDKVIDEFLLTQAVL